MVFIFDQKRRYTICILNEDMALNHMLYFTYPEVKIAQLSTDIVSLATEVGRCKNIQEENRLCDLGIPSLISFVLYGIVSICHVMACQIFFVLTACQKKMHY